MCSFLSWRDEPIDSCVGAFFLAQELQASVEPAKDFSFFLVCAAAAVGNQVPEAFPCCVLEVDCLMPVTVYEIFFFFATVEECLGWLPCLELLDVLYR